jgi:hypothetical protein
MNKKMAGAGRTTRPGGNASGIPDIAGDWRGAIKTCSAELRLALHIDRAEGGLVVTMDSPDQGASGARASSVKFDGVDLRFNMEPVRGTYEGKVSGDGTAIKGTWAQGGQPVALDFERGIFEKLERRPGRASDIDGAWSGTFEAGPKGMRIVFHIANMEDGLMATAESPDQGVKGLPVHAVTRDGASIRFDMRAQGAEFAGQLSRDLATISGTFTQMGKGIPLVLSRVKDSDNR